MIPTRKTLYDLIKEFAVARPHDVMLFNEDMSYTANQFCATVISLANRLYLNGTRRGRYLVMRAERTLNTLLWFYAAQIMGAIAVMIDPHENLDAVIKGHNICDPIMIDVTDEIKKCDGDAVPVFEVCDNSKSTTLVIFTSGSMGGSKAVKLSQYAFINCAYDTMDLGDYRAYDIGMALLPFHHVFALALSFIAITLQHSVFIPKRTNAEYICECIENYKITRMNAVPSLYSAIAEFVGKYDLQTLRCGFIGGASCPPERFAYIEKTLNMTLIPVYGMSECMGISCSSYKDDIVSRANSVGKIYSMNEVKIAADNEILVKSPALFNGYLNAESGIDKDGFLHTGDLGYLDDDGYLHISGRKKELIIRNGNNISIADIERKICSLGCVSESVVVGMVNDKNGEVPCAAIVLKKGCAMNRDALTSRMHMVLNKLEMPYKTIIVRSLPLLSSGKPDKSAIKRLMESDFS